MDLNTVKRSLRREMLSKRASLSGAYIRSAGEAIAGRLLKSGAYARARSVFVYVSVDNEPPTFGIIKAALADGKKVYVPKCAGPGEMAAARIRAMEDLAPGAYGIPEPKTVTGSAAPEDLDLVIVPCVAASRDGKRLGHGAGYYDRFLENGAGRAVCLCFEKMLRDDIPQGEHDVLIPWVLTEAPAGEF